MNLRTRILGLFLGLGVAPIVALGVLGYLRSMDAVETLVRAQTASIARQTADRVADRYDLRRSELRLLTESPATQGLLRASAGRSTEPMDSVYRQANEHLLRAWSLFGASYTWIQLLEPGGSVLYALGSERSDPYLNLASLSLDQLSGRHRLYLPIPDVTGGEPLGAVVAVLSPESVLPYEALSAGFGEEGHSVVVDRREGVILYHPRSRLINRPIEELLDEDGWAIDPELLAADSGSFVYGEGSTRLAAFRSLRDPRWTVISSAALSEFAAPFQHSRTGYLGLVLVAALAVTLTFLWMVRRAMRSLQELTVAADRVAVGDLDPELPPAGADEVGRLSAAFARMIDEVRAMLRRVEETRHMAAVGEFASRVSHEIRNPLTSIKLNLQNLSRDVEAGELPDRAARPVEICLREVHRLDAAVRRVLETARTHPPGRVPVAVHDVLEEALALMEPQFSSGQVRVRRRLGAGRDLVDGDPEDLKSAILHLLANAQEAMPAGGTIEVETNADEADGCIRIRIRDEGGGVPPEIRDEVFRPFVSTKGEGTGFGLPTARRIVDEHGGHMELEDGEDGGAVFLIELPLREPE